MPKLLHFAGHIFTDVMPNPEGDIFIKSLEPTGSEDIAVLVGLEANRSYTPDAQSYRNIITVLQGSGEFFLEVMKTSYGPGSRFDISPNTPYSFIRTSARTVFQKCSFNIAEGALRDRQHKQSIRDALASRARKKAPP